MIDGISAGLLVLGSIALLRFGLQWSGLAPAARPRRTLRVVESCALGAKQRIHLVEAEGERLLLGTSESGVTLLRSLPPGQPAEAPAADGGTEDLPDAVAPAAGPVSTGRVPAPSRGRLAALRAALGSLLWLGLPTLLASVAGVSPAEAQEAVTPAGLGLTLSGATEPEGIASTLEVVALLTMISVAPSILLMATCFTRIVIVFAFLRQAIGIHQLPPSQVLVGLAFFTTLFVMAPVGEQIRVDAYEPYVARTIDAATAGERAIAPVRRFLLSHTREADLDLFLELAGTTELDDLEEVPLTSLLPAYMISELRTAFEIGFMIYLPFLVIDIVIASMLISMGMIVLPPIVISLPFKLMLFVLLDGWNLVVASLVTGLQ